MKKTDLPKTFENIKKTFIENSIGRNENLVYFIKLIDSLEESYSIALDSYWGSGKTFFVKQIEMLLNVNNVFTYDSIEDKESILQTWEKLLNDDKINTDYHIPIYYDAWENDNDNDPILSIVYQIIKTIGDFDSIKGNDGLSGLLNIAGDIFDLINGFNPLEIAKRLKSDNPLESIIQAKSLKERIDDFIDNLIPEHGERLLIIIDELDRCNPYYAVKLLERIKHYFNNDRITFVFSVNMLELQHTINNFYGADFNASKYLDRFFDLRISLPPINMNEYLLKSGVGESLYLDISISRIIKMYNMQLREISKYIPMVRKASEYPQYQSPRNTRNVIFHIILPIAIGLWLTDISKYNKFINGKDPSEMKAFLHDAETLDSLYNVFSLMFDNDSKDTLGTAEDIINNLQLFYQILDEFYNALFNYSSECIVGRCRIYSSEREYLKNKLSLIDYS